MSVNERMTAIADAIREKTGDTAKLSLDSMAQTIRKLPDPIVNTAAGTSITLSDATDLKLRGLNLYGKTTQDGTPTPEAPVELVSAGDGGSIGVTVTGKNLFDPTLLSIEPGYNTFDESTGLWTTSNFGGWQRSVIYNIAGTGARDTSRMISVPENTPITIRMFDFVNSTGISESFRAMFLNASGKRISDSASSYNNTLTVTPPPGTQYIDILRTLDSGTLSFSKIQVEIGSIATEYEPYNGQTLTASTPNGLPGIPVTSGGNYTDETGQQWVCDEVDFGRGVYAQRIGNIESYNGEAVGDVYISSTGAPTTGAKVLYCLAQSDELALSAEELAAYAVLHTNYPNTTILNDGGAGMSVSYVADTKNYIDNKINAMAAAIVNA